MNYISLANVGVDFMLLASLAYLGYRIISNPSSGSANTGRLFGLENTLRGLIREADSASRELSQEMMRRQQSLERLLLDIQGSESRINRSIANVEDRATSLEQTIARTRVEQPMSRPTPAYVPPAPPQYQARESNVSIEPVSFSNPAPVSRPEPRASAPVMPEPEVSWGSVNIYGEPVGVGATAARPESITPRPSMPAPAYRPLVADIEREVDAGPAARRRATTYSARDLMNDEENISQVIQKAEAINAAAREIFVPDAEPIINRPAKKNVIETSAEPAEQTSPTERAVKRSDPRLGVLGAMKRQVQTL